MKINCFKVTLKPTLLFCFNEFLKNYLEHGISDQDSFYSMNGKKILNCLLMEFLLLAFIPFLKLQIRIFEYSLSFIEV